MNKPTVLRLSVLSILLVVALGILWWRATASPSVLVGDWQAEKVRGSAPHHANVAILDATGKAAWVSELLEVYGFPGVPRLSSPTSESDPDDGSRRWVIANGPLEENTRAQLRRAVNRGAWVVELGVDSAVCGEPAFGVFAGGEGTIRLHGEALDRVRWPAAVSVVPGCSTEGCGADRVLAWALAESGARTPLVVQYTLGKGTCTRWLGDLGLAVRLLRQGTPERVTASPRSEGLFKPSDLFAGELTPEDLDLPSADRLGYALAAQIARAPGADVLISPLPARSHGLAILTADQDFVPGEALLAQSAEVVPSGLTVTLTAANIGGEPDVVFDQGEKGLPEAGVISELAERGHDVGIHPNLVGLPRTKFRAVLAEHAKAFREAYGVAPRIVRNHHVIWSGYTEMASDQAAAGLDLNLDFVTGKLGPVYYAGFMTGSGLPMRFADQAGQIVPILQLATQLDDYRLIPSSEGTTKDGVADLITASRRLLAISRREHVAVTFLHHPSWWYETKGALQRALLQEASKHQTQVWGAGRFLSFTEQRRNTRIERTARGFSITTESKDVALLVEGGRQWKLDGAPVSARLVRVLGGTSYAEIALASGRNELTAM